MILRQVCGPREGSVWMYDGGPHEVSTGAFCKY